MHHRCKELPQSREAHHILKIKSFDILLYTMEKKNRSYANTIPRYTLLSQISPWPAFFLTCRISSILQPVKSLSVHHGICVLSFQECLQRWVARSLSQQNWHIFYRSLWRRFCGCSWTTFAVLPCLECRSSYHKWFSVSFIVKKYVTLQVFFCF